MEQLDSLIEFFGIGNLITFFIGLFLSVYFYFKSFFRLVYSDQKICENCNNINDWKNHETTFKSRIIFFNNGRKTLTEIEIRKLIVSSTVLLDYKLLTNNEGVKVKGCNNDIIIEFDYLDSNEFLVLEITHQGSYNIDGRIAESGKILPVETKAWLIINILCWIYIAGSLFYNFYQDIYSFGINFLICFGLYIIIRYFHKLFFIPDNITSRYLDVTDKWSKEFKNNF